MFKKITETDSKHNHLEKMTTGELLRGINQEDKLVASAVEKVIPQVETLVEVIVKKMKSGGRLFYIGSGTSGRLGIVDASECPPTFGVPHDWVIGIIAGGDSAIRKAVEFAEDDTKQGWLDLKAHQINEHDVLIGIAASGTTPYVISAMNTARTNQVITSCITCNPESPITHEADYPIEVNVGPEFVTGSTRMKSGTAQKLILNMISTSVMIKLGRVRGNKMVDMQLSNDKLVNRGEEMIINELKVSREEASTLLSQHGSVRKAIESTRS